MKKIISSVLVAGALASCFSGSAFASKNTDSVSPSPTPGPYSLFYTASSESDPKFHDYGSQQDVSPGVKNSSIVRAASFISGLFK